MELNESQTRALLINPPLVAVDWNLRDRTQFRFEVPVEGYDPAPWNGITDFCLYHPSGRVLSVVEAKRASRDPRGARNSSASMSPKSPASKTSPRSASWRMA